jgi:hypothetical protein
LESSGNTGEETFDDLDDLGEETPDESGEDLSDEDFSDVDPDTEDDPEKKIQKLAGKLAYELRDFDDSDKYSDTAKFAMSMTIAALDVEKMSDEDISGIESKLEKQFNDVEAEEEIEEIEEIEEEGEKILFETNLLEYGVETPLFFDESEEVLLFDVEEPTTCDNMQGVDEEVYGKKPKAPKNKKYQTSIGDLTVGRIEGDDDAITEAPVVNNKRNPFLYK